MDSGVAEKLWHIKRKIISSRKVCNVTVTIIEITNSRTWKSKHCAAHHKRVLRIWRVMLSGGRGRGETLVMREYTLVVSAQLLLFHVKRINKYNNRYVTKSC